MSFRELFVSPSPVFGGYQRTFEESDYVILGVPFDATSTYRTGARFAPLAIREASLNIETYSFRSGIDLEDLKIHDLGDLHVAGEVEETLKRLEKIARELLATRKLPVFIGGEHTITLGIMRAVGKSAAIISFDAHLDLRNEYMDMTTSHTTFMRRIHEQMHPIRIIEIGTRAVCKEELEYAEKSGIHFITNHQILDDGVEKTMRTIKEQLTNVKKTYITIDMDVLDPAFAPGVQNPEPDGLTMNTFLNLLCGLCDQRVMALDLVEVAPNYDNGTTAIQTARTLFEALCNIEKAKKI
ncbi:MAG: agmatinase [Candidatus Bathyarchaeia archaeon]